MIKDETKIHKPLQILPRKGIAGRIANWAVEDWLTSFFVDYRNPVGNAAWTFLSLRYLFTYSREIFWRGGRDHLMQVISNRRPCCQHCGVPNHNRTDPLFIETMEAEGFERTSRRSKAASVSQRNPAQT